MRNILSLLLTIALLVLGLGTCALFWYLSSTAEFARKPAPHLEAPRH